MDFKFLKKHTMIKKKKQTNYNPAVTVVCQEVVRWGCVDAYMYI